VYTPAEIFADLLAGMIQHVHCRLRRAMDGVTLLIDSTGIALNGLSEDWARFSAEVCGANRPGGPDMMRLFRCRSQEACQTAVGQARP